jgi:ABC-type Fe3+/spermidine/putrescine transport system ATPase subunit
MTGYFQIKSVETLLGTFRLGPVSLEMQKGEYLVLLGPTGCGKSSLMKCISGISAAANGTIFLDGLEISSMPAHKRHIGYVSQFADLFPHLTVRRNVAYGLKYLSISHSESITRVSRYLDLFGLGKLADRMPSTLSGGESRKTAMARSLIINPRMLLLDEPLGMLDHNSSKEMLGILRMIHEELQTTTIHVTHDRHEAWNVSESCAVMNEGRILQTGNVAELFRAPKSRFVAEFLVGTNIFEASFDGTRALVEWGTVSLYNQPAVKKGWILIRPEGISFVPAGKACKASGKVAAVKDFGEFIEIEVKIKDSAVLVVHSSIDKAGKISAGDEVYLDWTNESAYPMTME